MSSRLGRRLNGKPNRLENYASREQQSDMDNITEELIDSVVTSFLQQVEDRTWISGGWPRTFTDYSVSKLVVNAYPRFMAGKLSDRPEGKIFEDLLVLGSPSVASGGSCSSPTHKERHVNDNNQDFIVLESYRSNSRPLFSCIEIVVT